MKSSGDQQRRARVLVAAEGELARALVEALAAAPSWTFDVETVHPTEANFDRVDDPHDLFLVDCSTLDPHVNHSESQGRGPIIAVSPESEPIISIDRAHAAGAFDLLSSTDITPTVLERTIRHALEHANMATSLRDVRARHDLVLRAANDGLWEWDLQANEIRYSHRWKQLFGLVDEDVGDSRELWFSRVHDDDIEGLRANIDAHIHGSKRIHEFEHRIRQPDGGFRWVLSRGLVSRDRWGRAIAMAGSLTDINDRKRAEALAAPHPLHDELTGLPSRRVLIERLEQAIEQNHRDAAATFSVVFLNVDRFKVLNDSIGLDSADRILRQLAERLRSCVPEGVVVCRYGGDEFAILLEGAFDVADALARRIHELLSQPFALDEQTIFATASIGITTSTRNYATPADVIRDASAAMRWAKRHSKSFTATYDTAMTQGALNTLRMYTQLREAIDNEQFEVYYQPIVALGSWRLTGFEALVRWNHPKRGIVGPVEFIQHAEDTGLINQIGQFVLRAACSQLAAWRRRFPDADDISISINLSGHQLKEANLVADIKQVLDDTGLPADRVKLELTESTLIDDPDAATRVLNQLRERGIKLYIDDFGTGYSSLSYLHRFAIDGLKIDKSFVDTVGLEDRKAAIVPSIVGLAHNLGMGVVAEGVETREQARELTLLDCGEAQGYLFSRPVPSEQAAVLIARRILLD